jgi:long-subunit fatty acid transport protein
MQTNTKKHKPVPGGIVLTLFICVFCFQTNAHAQSQTLRIPSSPNPVGSGPRAFAMGGAYISIADTATSGSWNPAGLVQVKKPEISIVGALFHRIENNSFELSPNASGRQSVENSNINFASFTFPCHLWNLIMTFSINYQHLYDFNREWNFSLLQETKTSQINKQVAFKQKGQLSALGIAYGIRVAHDLYLGFSLNFWNNSIQGTNYWERINSEKNIITHKKTGKQMITETYGTDRYELKGQNINLGMKYTFKKFTLGGVLKTSFKANLNHQSYFKTGIPPRYEDDAYLNMPMSYGIGLSYRASDALTVAADIYRTKWQDFIFTDAEGVETSPISGFKTSESTIGTTTQVRMGLEYLRIKRDYVVPFRCGLFYDPAPAENSPDHFWGLSLGSGIVFNGYIFDFAYQYRFGRSVGKSMLQYLNFSQDVDEHTMYGAIIVHLQ